MSDDAENGGGQKPPGHEGDSPDIYPGLNSDVDTDAEMEAAE